MEKRDSALCHYGGGSYGSPPDSKKCPLKHEEKRQLCQKHEALWRVEAKKRAAAKKLAQTAEAAASVKAKAKAKGKLAVVPQPIAIARIPKATPQQGIEKALKESIAALVVEDPDEGEKDPPMN